jgi:alcohol dehydrogenase class IV
MHRTAPANPESVFTYGAPQLKFGSGACDEIGFDLHALGARRVLVVTDPGVAATGHPQRVADSMASFGIETEVYDGAHVEPTDVSLTAAVEAARASGPWDAYVAVGGGSAIDTAKAINLLTTNPGELLDYVNVPVGGGQAPSQPLKPLVAVPTTTGTGSESTTICVLDVLHLKVKTGISHARLRPTLAVVDPELTRTQPAGVTAASGMDVLCHALESYTARWYTSNEHKAAAQRVPYCGSNPISDMWSEKALVAAGRLVPHRRAARRRRPGPADMAIAATFAGMGLRQRRRAHPARQRLPDRRQVKDFHPKDYPADEPMVPHGMSVSLHRRRRRSASPSRPRPERHLRAAELLAPGRRAAVGPGGVPAAGAVRPHARHRDPQRHRRRRLRRGRRRRPRRRGDEAAAPARDLPARRDEDDLAGIFSRSLELW